MSKIHWEWRHKHYVKKKQHQKTHYEKKRH